MQLEVGNIVEGKVTGITKFGAFVELPGGKTGMVHISEVAPTYVNEIRDHVTENQVVKVKILNITEEGKISLSIKRAMDRPAPAARRSAPGSGRLERPDQYDWNGKKKNENLSFEDMLNKFKQTSDDKISDLKKYNEGKRPSSRRGSSK
ncbi:MAG: S1 RNA-binding domain-containing protein [Oscillospiraceae bacterium]|nr:S1 RNA-binding domain-containing protein [Oscillospiraceae bacterium]